MTSELSIAFRSMYACNAKELRELSMRAKDLSTTRPLTHKQVETQDTTRQRITDIKLLCDETVQRKERTLTETKNELERSYQAQEKKMQYKDEVIEKRRRLEVELGKKKASVESLQERIGGKHTSTTTLSPIERYRNFLKARSQLSSEIKYYTWLLRNITDLTEEELKNIVDLTDAQPLLHNWDKTVYEINERVVSLQSEGAALQPMGALDVMLKEITSQWDVLKRARSLQENRLATEFSRRDEKEHSINVFLNEQTKLLQWCREQTVQLEGLQPAEHVQEFCASLQNNNNTMEANFTVLSDMAEALLPNTIVRKALIDVGKEWFHLQVYTYERLRQCLLDQHHNSNLEEELRAWSTYFYPVKEYLHTVEGLLQQPTEEEAVAFLTPLLESVRTLQNEAVPHQLIVDHLADFTLRMQCIQENYTALRPSIFSTLSLLYHSLTVNAQSTWKQREEYQQKMAELSDWMDLHSQSDLWSDLLKRVEKVKQVVEEAEPLSPL